MGTVIDYWISLIEVLKPKNYQVHKFILQACIVDHYQFVPCLPDNDPIYLHL